MKFILNEYHRNIPTDALIQDVKNVALQLGKRTLTTAEYNSNGKYHYTTIRKRIGSWEKTLELADLEVDIQNSPINRDDYIDDVRSIAMQLNKKTLTSTEYKEYGRFGFNSLLRKFGNWEQVLLAADLQPTGYTISVSDAELLDDIEQTWIKIGRQPTTGDIKSGLSSYRLTTYIRHFGSWRKALERFVEYINSEDELSDLAQDPKIHNPRPDYIEHKHKTQRDINLRIRFLVMKRDNFKCCLCGASPASDPSITLHIDHIIPWSKGGETVMDNLQTLCSKCNLGKSNLPMNE